MTPQPNDLAKAKVESRESQVVEKLRAAGLIEPAPKTCPDCEGTGSVSEHPGVNQPCDRCSERGFLLNEGTPPQPTLLPFDLAKALPAGHGVLSPVWLETNPLPSEAVFFGTSSQQWLESGKAGQMAQKIALGTLTYAAPLDSAPPEAFLADSAQEASAVDVSVLQMHCGIPTPPEVCSTCGGTGEVEGANLWLPCPACAKRDPNYDGELKAAREELAASETKRKEMAKDFETAFRLVRKENDELRAALTTVEQKRDAFSRDAQLFMDQRDKLQAQLTTAETHAKSLEGRVKELEVVIRAQGRLNDNKYLPWHNAGGPEECPHGYAFGIPCPKCDFQVVFHTIALLRPATAGPEVQP
jgi:hypothetical protein